MANFYACRSYQKLKKAKMVRNFEYFNRDYNHHQFNFQLPRQADEQHLLKRI